MEFKVLYKTKVEQNCIFFWQDCSSSFPELWTLCISLRFFSTSDHISSWLVWYISVSYTSASSCFFLWLSPFLHGILISSSSKALCEHINNNWKGLCCRALWLLLYYKLVFFDVLWSMYSWWGFIHVASIFWVLTFIRFLSSWSWASESYSTCTTAHSIKFVTCIHGIWKLDTTNYLI